MTKAEIAQSELFKAETTWFHVFKDMIDSGDMAKLDGSAIKVYLVVKAHTNFSTGRAFPALETIAEKSGLSVSQVKRCLNSLEEFQYITKEKAGRHNAYTLREKVNITDGEGRPQAVATWDYIPNSVRDAVAEIKNAVVTGEMVGGSTVNIANLNLFVNISNGESTQFNINATDYEKLPAGMREQLEAIRAASRAKKA